MPKVSGPKKLQWTFHSRSKMRQYRLSDGRVLRVLHAPKRVETGVAPKTIACMQPASQTRFGTDADWTQEIWVMVQDAGNTRKVISVWRYPGKTKPRDEMTKEFLAARYGEYLSGLVPANALKPAQSARPRPAAMWPRTVRKWPSRKLNRTYTLKARATRKSPIA